jgi:hypothetical protein
MKPLTEDQIIEKVNHHDYIYLDSRDEIYKSGKIKMIEIEIECINGHNRCIKMEKLKRKCPECTVDEKIIKKLTILEALTVKAF